MNLIKHNLIKLISLTNYVSYNKNDLKHYLMKVLKVKWTGLEQKALLEVFYY